MNRIFSILVLSVFVLHTITSIALAADLPKSITTPQSYYGKADIKQAEFTSQVDIFGKADVKKSKMNKVNVFGELEADDLIADVINVQGTLDIKESQVSQATSVEGVAKIKRSSFSGIFQIEGSLKAEKSNFGDISAAADKIDLKECHAKNILIKKGGIFDRQQEVILSKDTVISGVIEFESGNGLIILEDKDIILKPDQIKGGQVQQKKSKHFF